MIAKGNFTLEKNKEIKSIIRLFFCDSRVREAHYLALNVEYVALSSFPARDSFERLFNVYPFLESARVLDGCVKNF